MRILRILFSLEGRVNRLQFWLAVFIMGLFTTAIFATIRFVGDGNDQPTRVARAVLFCFWLFIFGWTLIAISTKRWHDMGHSGSLTLLWLVPLIGWLLVLGCLGFLEGTKGRNKHGRDPSEPT